MSPEIDFSQLVTRLETILATDARLAPLGLLAQIADAPDASAAAKDYNRALETKLATPGVALVAVIAEGRLAGAPTSPTLDMWNLVMLSIVENTAKNATGLTAHQYAHRAMRAVHRASLAIRGARASVKLDETPYTLGPLKTGTVVYFVQVQMRSIEETGVIAP